jgi:transposase, IS5 family
MRLACPEGRLDCLPITAVPLNLNCRDEIIPILRALQHLYGHEPSRRELLHLVGQDINTTSSSQLGRRGMNYWEITVLAAARLGCNLDYDKLQDLAENHRTLRRIMGIGDWQDQDVDFDWRRIEDNVIKPRPATLKKISDLIVGVGHQLRPQAIKAVRGDSFVVETNIHYPTESSLIGDGLRKVIGLAAELARENGLTGWRQHKHWLKNVRQVVREIGRAARAKSLGVDRLKPGYQKLLDLSEELLGRACQLLQTLLFVVDRSTVSLEEINNATAPQAPQALLSHYITLTGRVCDTARRRVIHGETLANEEKIFSIFEAHTELIKRGKQPDPVQFGHKVLVMEDAAGFIIEHRVVEDGVLDQDVVVPVMRELQERFENKIQSASFDRGFHTAKNQKDLVEIVTTPCLASKGGEKGRRQQSEASVSFRRARQHHPGVESAIGALQSGNGLKRCRDRSREGYARYVGLGVLGRNLHVLGKLLLAQDKADCPASKSKRKRQAC